MLQEHLFRSSLLKPDKGALPEVILTDACSNPKIPCRLRQRNRQQDDRQEQDGKKPFKSLSQN